MKQQKKLLVVFFITIFLPSVSLSIFGIVALRNEKFRLAKQIENEQIQIANSLKGKIETKLEEIEKKLENLANYPSFRQKDYPVIKELLTGLSKKDSLIGIIFLLYKDEEPLFPLFQAGFEKNASIPVLAYNNFLQQQIKNAEDAEYIRNDYLRTVSIYNDAFQQSGNKTIKARMLNHIARNLMKAGKFSEAADVYSKIINDFPDERTESGLPLELHAKLQKTECQRMLGDKVSATNGDLTVFEELLENRWNLNESQFKTYSSIVIERLTGLQSDNAGKSMVFNTQFELLKKQFQYKTVQWQTISNIKSYIVPELLGFLQTNSISPSSFEFSKRIGNEDYLITAVTIPGQNQPGNAGMLGIKLNSIYLQNNILNNAIQEIQPLQNTVLCITTLSGDSIKGNRNNVPGAITTTALFDNNFPPWRLELAYVGPKGMGEINIFTNFYFWTIITLIIILVFGTALIARIVAREMEILKIKSDFVSSVSHEFKTPLTSMKALTERLEKGKVTEPAKMKQYISIISYDIDRLIRLVGNILNFSNIEEGKKVYKKEETDIAIWLKEAINNYKKESFENKIDIHVQLMDDMPAISIDKDAMTQAIFNLLDNAVKFSRGDVEAEVTAEKNGNTIIIKVKDKGIGIENDEKDKIFEKFYRGESAVKYFIKGTGLGLALVKYTIEAHNGHIVVESEPGWSTVFTITLPISEKK
ncbi:MAG: HAMP domain-containing histidine kinase [Bacteroidetes bacterium]|nr:HAMP domain-containing histidine kinase [Bacteroidota bacterium]